mgnify:CR=1 FL=1
MSISLESLLMHSRYLSLGEVKQLGADRIAPSGMKVACWGGSGGDTFWANWPMILPKGRYLQAKQGYSSTHKWT